jgi:flagellar biosynthesis protein FlhB
MDYLVQGLIMSAPITLAMMAVGLAGNLFQTRFLFSTEPLKPDFNRLNPIQGFKNIFSQKAFVGLIKNLVKLGLVGYVSWRTVVIGQLKPIVRASSMATGKLLSFFTGLMGELLVNVAILMFVLGMADYLYQHYDYKKGLRMTKQETKEEYKAMEGDPRFKQFRRQKQKQLAEQRMMQRVPEATVVITNPTHYAVAVRYDASRDAAPLVVAKGLDLVAENIKKIAKAHEIPMIENRELARRMYRESEIGDEVPVMLYQAMAEILAMVYTLKK